MNFLEKLNKAIDLEFFSQTKQKAELQKLTLQERVLKGETITDVKIHLVEPHPALTMSTGSDGKLGMRLDANIVQFTEVIVSCDKNISKFSEGSRLILHNNKYSFELIVSRDSGNEMLLESGFGYPQMDKKYQDSTGWELDTSNPDIRSTTKKSIEILRNDPRKLQRIQGIFDGNILPVFSEEREELACEIVKDTILNETQKIAFCKAFSTQNYYLIQGPPGTGKTWILAYLAAEFAKEGKKVLITAFTHTGINNALQKCSILAPDQEIYKIGKSYQTDNLNYGGSRAKNIEHINHAENYIKNKGLIVGATAFSPYTNKMKAVDWDVVIIDEAGQMPIHLGIAAMAKAEKYIFIGDHKQLAPIISEDQDDPVFQKSIFEHLFQFSEGTMLDITYRLNKEINRFSSDHFYKGRLEPHPDNADWKLEIDNNFQKHGAILDINQPEVLVCHQHVTDESRSEFEANLIAELVEQYIEQGIRPVDIAIITPLRAQAREIKLALSKLKNAAKIKKELFVDTVERMQGQEREVIFYSLVVSDPEKAMQRPEFYFNPNRLNVALTRAKKKRIVIANKNLFQINTPDKKLAPLIRLFKEFFEASSKFDI